MCLAEEFGQWGGGGAFKGGGVGEDEFILNRLRDDSAFYRGLN